MSEQETPRTVEEAARTEVVHILDSFGVQGGSGDPYAVPGFEGLVGSLLAWQAARMPSVEQVAEAIDPQHVGHGCKHDPRPAAERVVALWGAL